MCPPNHAAVRPPHRASDGVDTFTQYWNPTTQILLWTQLQNRNVYFVISHSCMVHSKNADLDSSGKKSETILQEAMLPNHSSRFSSLDVCRQMAAEQHQVIVPESAPRVSCPMCFWTLPFSLCSASLQPFSFSGLFSVYMVLLHSWLITQICRFPQDQSLSLGVSPTRDWPLRTCSWNISCCLAHQPVKCFWTVGHPKSLSYRKFLHHVRLRWTDKRWSSKDQSWNSHSVIHTII